MLYSAADNGIVRAWDINTSANKQVRISHISPCRIQLNLTNLSTVASSLWVILSLQRFNVAMEGISWQAPSQMIKFAFSISESSKRPLLKPWFLKESIPISSNSWVSPLMAWSCSQQAKTVLSNFGILAHADAFRRLGQSWLPSKGRAHRSTEHLLRPCTWTLTMIFCLLEVEMGRYSGQLCQSSPRINPMRKSSRAMARTWSPACSMTLSMRNCGMAHLRARSDVSTWGTGKVRNNILRSQVSSPFALISFLK